MPVIIGTAGHIDHGKTLLIKALTGHDTDRLKEEKERGISIDLGFAFMDLPSGERVGVVDVPGHERFIRNMLAGAHGIDLVLLVVAADDGVMPQTEEHVDIVHLLGVKRGIVAITKADLVDATRIEDVREETEILLSGTSLEGAPMIAVSSVTGAGVEDLREAIRQRSGEIDRVARSGSFRLPIDRAFVIHGHGTVVTGTAIAGSVRPGDPLRILPAGTEVRARSVQVHERDVPEATAGQRVALNIAGAERTTVGRGQVLCASQFARSSNRLDAWIEVRPAAGKPLKSHAAVRIYAGTAEVFGKIVWLDGRTAVSPREAGFGQLVLRDAVHAVRGDRFVLRNETAQRTIGGGVIVHPLARKHRSSEADVALRLERLRTAGSAGEIVRALLGLEAAVASDLEWLAEAGGLTLEEVRRAVLEDPDMRPLPQAAGATACMTIESWHRLQDAVLEALHAYHRAQPLAPGMEMEPLRGAVARGLSSKIFRAFIDTIVAEKIVSRRDSLLHLPAHKVALRQDEADIGKRAEALIVAGGFTPVSVKDVEKTLGVARAKLQAILKQLEREGRIVQIDADLSFGPEALNRARALLRAHVEAHGQIDAATFRDLLGASRKFSIALLDYFDRTGYTLRVGDIRKLRR